ncbi:PQQ-dependent sugar dehydrogenase [Rhodohalobacter sp. SW132]|nr:PQQ-dependent sugar dehydrogenase [Rhodohalobacter sp. SW132]
MQSDAYNSNGENDEFETRTLGSQYVEMELDRIAGPFEHPWSVAFLSDDRMLVTERPGRLVIVENGELTTVEGTPEVHASGQGGMMDVLPHPDYEENGWIYLTYSKSNGSDETATTLVRGRLDENNSFVDMEEIFVQNRYSSPGRHYGSRLVWHNDGTLLMSVGDRGADPPRAQATDDHAGTLLRLNDDGSVPDDNPFVNDPDVANEIYTYGHRNIQGLIVNQETDEIWSTEHGPRGGDELNYHQAGENYGWPVVTLGRDYGSEGPFPDAEARTMEGMVDPVYEFLPTHAPSGLALVTSDQFPAWEGNLLAGGLRSERIRRLVLYENEVIHDEELLLGEVGRIRDVRQGPDGNIYVVTDSDEGYLYRVSAAE